MRLLSFAFASLSLLCASAQAQTVAPANQARLQSFSPQERSLLRPYLDRGPVLLAMFRQQRGEMPPIAMAARVEAPAAVVADVIAHPERYPRFMPALDTIDIESREGTQIAYRWTWQLALFTLTGRNVMTVFQGNATRGYRIDVRSTGGDLGLGRLMWRVIPEGSNRCTVVLAQRVDMRDANYLADQLSSGGTSVQRSINISMATVMLLGAKDEAERQSGRQSPSFSADPLIRPSVDVNALAGLLGRGDLVMMELDDGELGRISVVARSGTRREQLRRVMVDPAEFGRTLIDGSHAEVVERREDDVVFEWGIPLPLVGIEGRMSLKSSDTVISVDGVSGSLHSGRWRFDTHTFPWGEEAIVGWARFDPGEASRLVRRIIGGDAHFSQGLAAATQVMIARSLRRRALGR